MSHKKSQKFIAGKSINLREVGIADAEFILALRCNEEKAKFLHKTENDLAKQIAYIENYKTKENEWYFIIESKSGEQLGTVRIYDVVDNDDFCWGSWIIKDSAPANAAIESVLLVYEYAFYTLGFTKAHFDVRKDNAKVRAFHKRFGAKEVSENDKDVFYRFYREDYEMIKGKFRKFLV
ncbi:GNAT family N-acetyltransferase [Helicobacter sp. 23-1048]